LLPPAEVAMSDRRLVVTDDIHHYILENSLREPGVLARLREETSKLPHATMQIGPEQGEFMALLVKLINAKRCIEIGVFTGYSALVVALALPEDGKIIACDVNEEWTSIGRRYWLEAGVAHKIDLRLQPALKTLDALVAAGESASYDYAFIDADKPNYDAYYERVLQLLRPGGLFLIDNVLWSGKVADPEAADKETMLFKKLNAKLHKDERVDISLLGIGDGLTVGRKR
jgi:predicted O-methyltransferase YrrM